MSWGYHFGWSARKDHYFGLWVGIVALAQSRWGIVKLVFCDVFTTRSILQTIHREISVHMQRCINSPFKFYQMLQVSSRPEMLNPPSPKPCCLPDFQDCKIRHFINTELHTRIFQQQLRSLSSISFPFKLQHHSETQNRCWVRSWQVLFAQTDGTNWFRARGCVNGNEVCAIAVTFILCDLATLDESFCFFWDIDAGFPIGGDEKRCVPESKEELAMCSLFSLYSRDRRGRYSGLER